SDMGIAYGASLAGGSFDFQKFVKQPHTIVRFFSWVSLTKQGTQRGITWLLIYLFISLAFLACFFFLLLDAYLPLMSNAKERKYAVMADLGFSGVWTFLWFVCFCLLASQWSRTLDVRGIPQDAARATIAFSFFSIATWGILTYFALVRYRRGVADVTQSIYAEPPPEEHTPYHPTYAPSAYTPTTYSPYPSSVPDDFQQPPFTPSTITTTQPQGDYQPPTY
uniref:Synaptogyrin n=1 Tax=Hucho hucho TaxID=62062 RepID=A0A4W5R0P7_9TELE